MRVFSRQPRHGLRPVLSTDTPRSAAGRPAAMGSRPMYMERPCRLHNPCSHHHARRTVGRQTGMTVAPPAQLPTPLLLHAWGRMLGVKCACLLICERRSGLLLANLTQLWGWGVGWVGGACTGRRPAIPHKLLDEQAAGNKKAAACSLRFNLISIAAVPRKLPARATRGAGIEK